MIFTALIIEVNAKGVTVIQANVPYNWKEGQKIIDIFDLNYDAHTCKYFMPNVPTSQFGYSNDFIVVGWIRGLTEDTSFNPVD